MGCIDAQPFEHQTFVGGNLGIPLSEAAFKCLSSPQKPYQARSVANFIHINCIMLQLIGVLFNSNNFLNLFALELDPSKSRHIQYWAYFTFS